MARLRLLVLIAGACLVPVRGVSSSASNAVSVLTSVEQHRSLEDEHNDEENENEQDEEQQEEQDQDSHDSNDGNNDDDAANDDEEDNIFTQFYKRIEEDVMSMWSNSPSSWVAEYWEVFGVIAFVGFLLLGCHCFIAYDMCCLGGNNPTGRKTVTQEEFQMQQKKRDQQMGTYSPPMNQAKAVRTDTLSPGSSAPNSPMFDPVISAWNTMTSHSTYSPTARGSLTDATVTSPGGSSPDKNKKRKKPSLFTEVANVWSEFLGCNGTDDESAYRRYEEEKRRKRRTGELSKTTGNEIV